MSQEKRAATAGTWMRVLFHPLLSEAPSSLDHILALSHAREHIFNAALLESQRHLWDWCGSTKLFSDEESSRGLLASRVVAVYV